MSRSTSVADTVVYTNLFVGIEGCHTVSRHVFDHHQLIVTSLCTNGTCVTVMNS